MTLKTLMKLSKTRAHSTDLEETCLKTKRSCPDQISKSYFLLQDVSEIAVELGFPSCSVDQFVAEPESGMTLPNPAIVPNFSQPIPPEGHEWIYPYTTQPHYLSQNAGPW